MNQPPFRLEGFSLAFAPPGAFLAVHSAGSSFNLHLHALGVGSAMVEPVASETKLHMYEADHSTALGRGAGSTIRRWDVKLDKYQFTLPAGVGLLAASGGGGRWELVVPARPASSMIILRAPISANRVRLPDGSDFGYSSATMSVVDVGVQLDEPRREALITGLEKGDRQLLQRSELTGVFEAQQLHVAEFSAKNAAGKAVRERWYFIPVSPGLLVTFVCQALPQDYPDAVPLADKAATSFRQL